MARTLDDLLTTRTRADVVAQLVSALKGVGFVSKTGTGTGSLTASGVPIGTYAVVVKITTAGELGTGAFQYSLDEGATYSSAITIPVGGVYTLLSPVPPASGASVGTSVTFVAGPAGAGTSFVVGDTYSLSLSVPTFPVDSWQAGSVARTLIEIDAQAIASLSNTVKTIAEGGFLDRAKGPWLDLLVSNFYDLTRNVAVVARGPVTLTDAQSSGPHTIVPGDLWFASSNGLRYTNVTGGTLPKGGTLAVTVQAEAGGAAYNVAVGTITTMITPLPGVTATNPTSGNGVWQTTSGTDEESDAAYSTRAKARWAALGSGATAEAYALWAATASAEVTRTTVGPDPLVPGQVLVYIAGASGAFPGGSTVPATVQANIDPRTPLGISAVVVSATNVVVPIVATVRVKAAYRTAAEVAVASNMEAFFSSLPIGATVYRSAIIEQAMIVDGVEDFAMSSPAADTVLSGGQVATHTRTLTWVST